MIKFLEKNCFKFTGLQIIHRVVLVIPFPFHFGEGQPLISLGVFFLFFY